MSWVRPGVELVFTRRLRFTRVLIREDFPTLDRPVKAISGKSRRGIVGGFNSAFNKISRFYDHGVLDSSPVGPILR